MVLSKYLHNHKKKKKKTCSFHTSALNNPLKTQDAVCIFKSNPIIDSPCHKISETLTDGSYCTYLWV